MTKHITVVKADGTVSFYDICKLSYLLILSALVLVSALAINEFFQEIISQYVRKDGLFGHFVYALLAILAVLIVAYAGCKWDENLVDYINVSPLA